MTTLTASPSSSLHLPPLPLHRDIRSPSLPIKRQKDSSSKWIAGTRPSPGVKTNWDGTFVTGSETQQAKVRPEKKWSDVKGGEVKTHANVSGRATGFRWDMGNVAAGRVVRKADARWESSAPGSMDVDGQFTLGHGSGNGSGNVTVAHPYATARVVSTSPRKATIPLGLDHLVSRAETEFRNRETDKLVREEYEILDAEGEITPQTVVAKGNRKKGKKGGVVVAVPLRFEQLEKGDEEDEWERI